MRAIQFKYSFAFLVVTVAYPSIANSQNQPSRSESCYRELREFKDITVSRISGIVDPQERDRLWKEASLTHSFVIYEAFLDRTGFFETPVTNARATEFLRSQTQAMQDYPGYQKMLDCMLRVAVSQDMGTPERAISLKATTSPATSKSNQVPAARPLPVSKDNPGDSPKVSGRSASMVW